MKKYFDSSSDALWTGLPCPIIGGFVKYHHTEEDNGTISIILVVEEEKK